MWFVILVVQFFDKYFIGEFISAFVVGCCFVLNADVYTLVWNNKFLIFFYFVTETSAAFIT